MVYLVCVTKACNVDDCNRVHYAKGVCQAHYQRQRGKMKCDGPIRVRGTYSHCVVTGCERTKVVGDGMCAAHWQRSRKGLDLDTPLAPRHKTTEERLREYTIRDDNGCLLWCAATVNGYGSITDEGGNGGRVAHRVAYELATGEQLDPWDTVHHKCAVRRCVEPSHLQRITRVENTAEMFERNWYVNRIAELEAQLANR